MNMYFIFIFQTNITIYYLLNTRYSGFLFLIKQKDCNVKSQLIITYFVYDLNGLLSTIPTCVQLRIHNRL